MFCQGNGLNGILKRREDEAGLLKWSITEAVHSSEPTSARANPHRTWLAWANFQFARANPSQKLVRLSEPQLTRANPFQRLVRLSHPPSSLDPSWLGPVRSSEPSQNAIRSNEPSSSLDRTVQNYWVVSKHDRKVVLRSNEVGLEPQYDEEE